MGSIHHHRASEASGTTVRRSMASTRSSMTDDEDYALQAMGISDGFRPSDIAHDHSSPFASIHDDGQSTPTPAIRLTSPAPPRPSSITKPHFPRESLSLRHDGPSTDSSSSHRRSLTLSRASSSSTVSPFASAEDPYEGPSGPSHPYEMYPQNVRLARTASLATTSTAPVSERSYSGPRGPTHPYGMYPQNTFDASSSRSTDRTMVGFGQVDNYERRIGPEGEEAGDLIGPDGHTEQLPPYTRYPEEAYHRKAMGVASPVPAARIRDSQSSAGTITGAGGLGLATRNPEFASNEDLGLPNSPQSRLSIRSFASEASNHDINAAARTVTDEKSGRDWQTAAKRRVWGVFPCWAIALASVVLLMMGIILGAVVGTVVTKGLQPHPSPHPDRPGPPRPEQSPTYDATPLTAVPSDLPPLAEGTFALPIEQSSATRECFADTSQSQTWQCHMVYSQLSISLNRLPDPDPLKAYEIEFIHNDSYTIDQYVYSYGMQPPNLGGRQPLRLVQDNYEVEFGPAWQINMPYNKTVVIPEEALIVDSSSDAEPGKRRRGFVYGDSFYQKTVAKPGDRPWLCYWEDTLFETFIYVEQDSSRKKVHDAYPSPSPTPAPTGASSEGSDGSEESEEGEGLKKREEHFPFGYVGQMANEDLYYPGTEESTTTTTSPTPTRTEPSWLWNTPAPTNSNPAFPHYVKVLERRVDDIAKKAPWCRKFVIEEDGAAATPYLDDDGHLVEVTIIEADADYADQYQKKREVYPYPPPSGFPEGYRREQEGSSSDSLESDMSDCGCMWWLT